MNQAVGMVVTQYQRYVIVADKASTYGQGLSQTFQSPENNNDEGLLALGGSLGFLEIAVQNGSAALVLNAGPGERVRVSFTRS